MLYFQVLFYIGSLFLLSYHYLQLIPGICKNGHVQGTSSQFVIFLVYHLNNTKRENIFGESVSTNGSLVRAALYRYISVHRSVPMDQ